MARVLQDAMKEWHLPMRLGIMLVTNNAANMKAAGRHLEAVLHVGCFAHTLNIEVQKALKVEEVDAVLRRVRRIVSFFHRSTHAATLLEQKALLLRLSATKLKIDICTRWNSAHDMLSRFLDMQDAVVAVIRSKELRGLREKDVTTLTDAEVLATEDVVKFLKPMKDMTIMLSSESMPTTSLILPLYYSLVGSNGHLSSRDDDSVLVTQMKTVMKTDLTGRYDGQAEKLSMITALDPRFKHIPFLSEGERHLTFNRITEEAVLVARQPRPVIKTEPGRPGAPTATRAFPALPDATPALPALLAATSALPTLPTPAVRWCQTRLLLPRCLM